MSSRRCDSASVSVRSNEQARGWLFDFDNTIAHLEREVDWAAGRRELEAFLRKAGVADSIFAEIPKGNLPLYEVLRARLSDPHSAALVARDGIPPASWGVKGEYLLREASSIIERYELAGIDRAEPTPGAIELLRAIAGQGKSIAIVTSNSSRTAGRWLERRQASSLIHAIVGRNSLLALKPSPAMVFEAMRRCGAAPEDAVFIGDSAADLGAAQAAGVKFYGIATNAVRHAHLTAAGAALIFDSATAVLKYLDSSAVGERE